MKKKVIIANEEALIRLRAIEMAQAGSTYREVAQQFNVHPSTISEWIKMYEEGGLERLKTYMKPRPKYELNESDLIPYLGIVKGMDERRINALIDLVQSGKLNETATKHGYTPQGLAKVRREYLEGKFPKSVQI